MVLNVNSTLLKLIAITLTIISISHDNTELTTVITELWEQGDTTAVTSDRGYIYIPLDHDTQSFREGGKLTSPWVMHRSHSVPMHQL